MPVIEIDGRIKRLWSISQKLKKQKIELEQVYDFIALRIITDSVKDCYAALGIIHQTWSPVPGRIKDFIAMPRPNGYQSLHTSVISEHGTPFEVQIRTIEMHRMAEEGIAAHWKYKEGRVGDHRDERYFRWMRQLLDIQQEVRDPQEFIQNLKVELYPEEVYTFTPKGQVKAFPRGATPIDFAYSIHTDVGHQCVGARINGKMVPLRSTAEERRHRRDHHAGRAQAEPRLAELRRHVPRALQDQAPDPARGEGARHRARPQGVREGGAPLRPQPEDAASTATEFADGARRSSARRRPTTCSPRSATASCQPKQVLVKLVPADRLREKAPDGPVAAVVTPRARHRRGEDQGPRLRRSDGLPRALLQSDPRREDRRLHHARQGRVGPLGDLPQRRQPAVRPRAAHRRRVGQGAGHDAAARYTVKLTMEVEDRKGLLAAVSAKIADINTNIKNMEAHTDEGRHARIDMTVEISDLKHLEKVIKSLQRRGRRARTWNGRAGGRRAG